MSDKMARRVYVGLVALALGFALMATYMLLTQPVKAEPKRSSTVNPAPVGGYWRADDGIWVPVTTANPLPVASSGASSSVSIAAGGNTAVVTANGNDGVSNSTAGLYTYSRENVYNGTTWDRARSLTAVVNSAATGIAAAGIVAQLDDVSPATVTEGNFGSPRMSSERAQYVAILSSATAAAGIVSVVSPSAEACRVLKASAGNLYNVYATNLTATAGFLIILNLTAAPADGAVTPLDVVALPANGQATINYNPGPPAVYSTGITACTTSAATPFTKTTGVITAFLRGAAR